MSSIPPGWYPDPSGEHQYRFWDGQRWTTRTAYPKNAQQTRRAEQPKPAQQGQPAQQIARREAATQSPRQEVRREQAVEVSGQELAAPVVSRPQTIEDPNEVKRHARVQAKPRNVEERTQTRATRTLASQVTTRQQRIRSLLQGGLQDAVIINEILGPPIGLRNQREQDL
ncbi:MAG: DUF2510 domain-containing protein [Ilumatobacteraceae bacterium]|nr:DUF2510 domain-containing protein [Ilumatobacteraceae bacterium]